MVNKVGIAYCIRLTKVLVLVHTNIYVAYNRPADLRLSMNPGVELRF